MANGSSVQGVKDYLIPEEPGSGVFKKLAVTIGLLGSEGEYRMPLNVLEEAAEVAGGMVAMDLPPFFVACLDGLVLILTLNIGMEYVGCAFVLPVDQLAAIDPVLVDLWTKASKDQDAAAFFEGTAFKLVEENKTLPEPLKNCWRDCLSC